MPSSRRVMPHTSREAGTISLVGPSRRPPRVEDVNHSDTHSCEPSAAPPSSMRLLDINSWSEAERGGDVMSDESPTPDRPTPQPGETPSGPDPATSDPGSPTRRTRISAAWVGVIIGVVVLAFLLAFIIQNGQSVKVSLFSAHVRMPLGVALLLAAVGGALLAGVAASLRIWQLRHRVRQSR
jgi:lipopolysaccharide assembly protein A